MKRGRILPSRRQLLQDAVQARFELGALKENYLALQKELERRLTPDQAEAFARYAVILALSDRQGTDLSPIVDQAYTDPNVPPAALELLTDILVKLSLHTLQEASL